MHAVGVDGIMMPQHPLHGLSSRKYDPVIIRSDQYKDDVPPVWEFPL